MLESGFLALFLTAGSRIVVWLYRWLLLRFMLMGGAVKLASGDPSWGDQSALGHHLETQPLPSPLAPGMPTRCPTGCCKRRRPRYWIELVVPFWVLMPRRPRLWAAGCFALLQGTSLITGNFAFFNLLTLAPCVFLLDDRDLTGFLPRSLVDQNLQPNAPSTTRRGSGNAWPTIQEVSGRACRRPPAETDPSIGSALRNKSIPAFARPGMSLPSRGAGSVQTISEPRMLR
ncbi:MAG: lipase maturation factor family protein [Methylococcaceae bacterium]|nr:lipase maturation factor family protein [Methylococcaceae bacterium]